MRLKRVKKPGTLTSRPRQRDGFRRSSAGAQLITLPPLPIPEVKAKRQQWYERNDLPEDVQHTALLVRGGISISMAQYDRVLAFLKEEREAGAAKVRAIMSGGRLARMAALAMVGMSPR